MKKNRNQNTQKTGSLFKKILTPGIWRKITSVLLAFVVFLTTYMMILPALTIDLDIAFEEPGMDVAMADSDLDRLAYDDASGSPPGVGESNTEIIDELSGSADALSGSFAAFTEETEPVPLDDETSAGYATVDNSEIPGDYPSVETFDDTLILPEELEGEQAEGTVEIPEEFGEEISEGYAEYPEEFGEELPEEFGEYPEEVTESLPAEEPQDVGDVAESDELFIEDAEAPENANEETEDEDINAEVSAYSHVLKTEGIDYRVTVSYTDEAEIPESAALQVTEIFSGESGYDQYVNEASEALSTEKRIMSVDCARFFDITIIDGEMAVEPKAPVTVLVELADNFAAEETAAVIHYTEDEAKVVETVDAEEAAASIEEAEAAEEAAAEADASSSNQYESDALILDDGLTIADAADADENATGLENVDGQVTEEVPFVEAEAVEEEVPFVGAEAVEEEIPLAGAEFVEDAEDLGASEPMNPIAFVTDSFSVYGFVTATLEKTVLASDGHNYIITVTCGADAGIPENAELYVREIAPEDEKYASYYEAASGTATAQAIERGMSMPVISSVRFFDIEIRVQDEKVEPTTSVRVNIHLLDAEEAEASAVVHFAKEGAEAMELLDNAENEEGIAFETASFSVYSVVDLNTIDLVNDGPFAIVTGTRGPGISTADGGSSVNRYALTTTTRTRAVNNEAARTTLAGKAVHLDTGTDPYTVGGGVPLWYFEDTGEGTYYIYTEDGGNRQYVTTYYTNLELTDNKTNADKFSVAVEGGMLRFGHNIGNNNIWYITNEGNNPSYFTQGNNTGNDTLFYLGKLDPDYEEQIAQKVSAADWGGTDFNENSTVMVYRKVVDEHGNESLWALGKDGNFYPIYDGGDAVYYHNTDDIDLEWHIVPTSDGGYWLGSSDGHFINPSLITGGMKWTSTTPASLRLSGMGSDYGTTIENWDQGQYDYVGLHWNAPVDEDSMPTVTPGVGQENDTFLFAVIDQGLIQPGAVHTVDTVDSTSLGVKMTMFNYGGDTYHYGYRNALMQQILGDNMQSDWDHRKGFVTRTVQNKLGSDGFPVGLTNGPEGQGGDSLAPLFSNGSITYTYNNEQKTVPVTGVPANNLFLQSYYDENGTFRYSSLENYAYLNPEPDVNNLYNFTVYREPGTPGVEPTDRTHYYFYHGHFMPYNEIDPNRMVSRVVDQFGWSADPDEGRTYEDIYGVQGTPDYYFGMSMEADFVQPAGGTLANGDPVVYKFTGDDDLWVFIDGVLVLDVSGIHEALSGSIDFETGEVWQPDFYGEGSYFGHHTTYLKDIFEAAGVAGQFEWNGKTFADYSAHTFKMFYMERGAGASNLDLQFNLQVSHPNKFIVRKELPEDIDLDYANVKFEYVAEYWEEDEHAPDRGHWKPLYAGAKKHPDDAHPVCTSVTYEDRLDDNHKPVDVTVGTDPPTQEGLEPGHFFLRPGEGAVFEMYDETTKYRVREIHIDRNMYTEVDINGVKVEDAGSADAKYEYEAEPQTPGSESTLYQASAGEATVRERPYVVYKNVPVTENLRIRKLLTADSLPLEEHDHPQFEFRAYVAQTVMVDGVETVEIRPYANDKYYLVKEVEPGVEHYFTLTGIDEVTERQNIPVDTEKVVGVDDPVVCGTTGRSGSMSMIPVGYDVIIPKLLAGTSFFIEEVQSSVPEGYTFVEKTVEHASDPDADDYVWRISASTGARLEVTDELGNRAVSMGKIEKNEHTDALVTAYNRREAADITVEKVWQGVDAEDMDKVTSTMALYVSSEAPSDKYPVTAKVNLVTWNEENAQYEAVSYGRAPSSVQAVVSWDGGSATLTLNNDNEWQGTVLVPKEKTATITYSIPDMGIGDGANKVDRIGKTLGDLSSENVVTTGITGKTIDEIFAGVEPIKTYTLTFVAQDAEGITPGAGWVKFTYEGHDYLLDMEEGWSKEFTVREDQNYTYKVSSDDCDRTFITEVTGVTGVNLGEAGTVNLPEENKTIVINVNVVDLTLDFPVSMNWGDDDSLVPDNAKVYIRFVDTSDSNNQLNVELTNGDWGPKTVSLDRLNASGRPLTYNVDTWIENGGTETARAIISGIDITPTPARANTVSDSVTSVIVNGEVASTKMNVPVTVTWTEETGYTMPQDGKVTVTLTERKRVNDGTEPPTYSKTLNASDFTGEGRLTWTGTLENIPRMNDNNDMITYSVTVTPDTASTDTRMMITRAPLSISDFEEDDMLNVEGRVLGPEPVKLRVVLRQESNEYEWYPSNSEFLEYAPGTRVRIRFNKQANDGLAVNWSTSWDDGQTGTIQNSNNNGEFWVTLPTEANEYYVYIQNGWGGSNVVSLLDVKTEDEVANEPLRVRIVRDNDGAVLQEYTQYALGAVVPVTVTLAKDPSENNDFTLTYNSDWGAAGTFPNNIQQPGTQRTVLITLPNQNGDHTLYVHSNWGADPIISAVVGDAVQQTIAIPVSVDMSGVTNPPDSVTAIFTGSDGSTVPVTLTGESWTQDVTFKVVDDYGQSITYALDTISVNGGGSENTLVRISGSNTNTVDSSTNEVVMTAMEVSKTMTVPVSIDWDDVTPPSGATVTVTFTGNGNTYSAAFNGTESSAWSGSIDLPRFDDDGNLISYSVTTSSFPATVLATSEVNTIQDDGSVSINAIINTMSVPVSISWGDVTPPSGSSVVVTISDGGENSTAVTLNSDNNWNATSTDLPMFDENRNVITYTVTVTPTSGNSTKFISLTGAPNTIAGQSTISMTGAVSDAVTVTVIRKTSFESWGQLLQTEEKQFGSGQRIVVTISDQSGESTTYWNASDGKTGTFSGSNGTGTDGGTLRKQEFTLPSSGTYTITLVPDWGGRAATVVSIEPAISRSGALSTTSSLTSQASGDVPLVGTSISGVRALTVRSGESLLLNSGDVFELVEDDASPETVAANQMQKQIEMQLYASETGYSEFVPLVGEGNSSGEDDGSFGDSGDSSGSDSGSSGGDIGSVATSTYDVYAAGDEPKTDKFYDNEITAANHSANAQPFTTVSSVKDLPEDVKLCTHYQIVKGDGGVLSYVDGDESTDGIQKVPDTVAVITGDGSYTWYGLPAADDLGNPLYYYVVEHGATADTERIDVDYEYEYYTETTTVNEQQVTEITGIKKVKVTNTVREADLTVKKTVSAPGADAAKQLALLGKVSFKIEDVTTDIDSSEKTPDIEFTFASLAEASGGKTFGLSEGIHYGHTYQVTETVTDDDADYSYVSNSYTVTVNGTSGTAVDGTDLTATTGDIILVNTNEGQYKAAGEAEFSNVYSRKAGDLELTKQVSGTGAETNRDFAFTINLTAPSGMTLADSYTFLKNDNAATGITYTKGNDGTTATVSGISLKHNDTFVIKDLPDGTQYTITESDYSTSGYSSSIPAGGLQGIITAGTTGTNAVTATNTLSDGNLTVQKVIEGNAADSNKEFNFSVTFEKIGLSGKAGTWKKGTQETISTAPSEDITFSSGTATITFALKGGEQAKFENVPTGTTFTVSETSKDADGYETTVSSTGGTANADKTVTGTISATTAVTASYVNTKNTVTAEAIKEWKSGSQTIDWPEDVEKVTFALFAKVGTSEAKAVNDTDLASYYTGIDATKDVDKNTPDRKAAWSNLPDKVLVGNVWTDVEYSVKETSITYTAASGKAAVTVNVEAVQGTITNDIPKTYVDVTKTWADPDNLPDDTSITVELSATANGTPYTLTGVTTTQTITKDSKNEDETVSWYYKWSDLPVYDDAGHIITYNVTETGITIKGNAVAEEDLAAYRDTPEPSNTDTSFFLKNKIPPLEKKALKEWSQNKLPANASVKLKISAVTATYTEDIFSQLTGTQGDQEQTLTGTDAGETAVENWTAVWSNLPKYYKGEEITYTVNETEYKIGNKTYTNASADATPHEGYDFSFTNDLPTVDIPVIKDWGTTDTGDDDYVEFTLFKGTSEIAYTQDGLTNPLRLKKDADEEKNWKGIFADLPMYDADGNEITWTVKETKVYFNGATYTGEDITNNFGSTGKTGSVEATTENPAVTLTNTPVTTSIKVTKKWLKDDGETDQIFNEEKSVEFTLYQVYTVSEETKDNVYTAYGTDGKGTIAYHPAETEPVEKAAYWDEVTIDGLPVYAYDTDTAAWYPASYYVEETAVSGVEITYQLGSNTPSADASEVTTDDDTDTITIVNTEKSTLIKIRKVDQDGDPLGNAVFKLSKNLEVYKDFEGADPETGEFTVSLSGSKAEFTIDGLQKGSYVLEETSSPGGYIKIAGKIKFTIGEDNTTITKADDSSADGVEFSKESGEVIITVKNVAAAALPNTGGRGTTMFYMIGLLLMSFACAGILMKSHRRKTGST